MLLLILIFIFSYHCQIPTTGEPTSKQPTTKEPTIPCFPCVTVSLTTAIAAVCEFSNILELISSSSLGFTTGALVDIVRNSVDQGFFTVASVSGNSFIVTYPACSSSGEFQFALASCCGMPTTQEPTTEEPTTEEPTTMEPTIEEPTTSFPTTKKPTTGIPTTTTPTRQPTQIGLPPNMTIDNSFADTCNVCTTNTCDLSNGSFVMQLFCFDTIYIQCLVCHPSCPNCSSVNHCSTCDSLQPPPTFQPTTKEPTTKEPTTELPSTSQPTTNRPTTSFPTTPKPTTEEPTSSIPTTHIPTAKLPTTSQPTSKQPTTVIPTTEQPTSNRPTSSIPTTREPTASEPTTKQPTTEEPTTRHPAAPPTTQPTTIEPTSQVPSTNNPTIHPTSSPTMNTTMNACNDDWLLLFIVICCLVLGIILLLLIIMLYLCISSIGTGRRGRVGGYGIKQRTIAVKVHHI